MNTVPPTACSWSEAMCASCVEQVAAEGWWSSKAQSLLTMDPARFECWDCQDKLLKLARRHNGAISFAPHLDMPQQLRSSIAAAHEAGHAVVSERSCNMIVDSATIEQQGTSGGRVEWDWDTLNRERNGVPFDRYAVAMFAGWAAERDFLISHGYNRPKHLVDAGFGSITDMSQLLERRPSPELFRAALGEAKAAVGDNGYEISAVRDVLTRSRRIDGTTVRRAMQAGTARRTAKTLKEQLAASAAITSLSGGSTTMAGYEEIAAAVSITRDKGQRIKAALAQIKEWAGEIAAELQGAVGGSQQAEAQQAIATFNELDERQITELHQQIEHAVSGIEQYSQRL